MSNYVRNDSNSGSIDYDRQFQDDLERAQALSLESLALEKFKMQKQQLDCNNYGRRGFTETTSACSSSISEVDKAQPTERLIISTFSFCNI